MIYFDMGTRMGNPIRVLQVIGIMNRGGAETMIMNLYRNIDRKRIQFDFIENSYDKAVFDDEIIALGGRVFRCPHYNGKNHFEYKNWWETFFRKHEGEYSLIHGHIGSTAAIYLNIAKKHGLYTIAHSHNSGTDHSIKAYLYKLASYNTRNIADYFFACSEAAGKDRYGERIVQSDHYKVLNNAIDTELFRYDIVVRKAVRDELRLFDECLIGHVGRFDSQKNHQFLLKIFKKVLEQKKNCKMLLVGDGSLRKEIEKQAEQMNIRDRIIFTGVRSDVSRLIQAMDVFVFPSLYEGLPVTLVEVQSSGLPCVISDKVPLESVLVNDLVTVCRLSDTSKAWADQCLHAIHSQRKDRSSEVAAAGYDISETAKWLGEFYLEKSRQP